MNKLVGIALALMILTGCTTNGVYDSGKTWTLVGIVAVGAIAASKSDGGGDHPHQEQCGWNVGPNGSTPIFCAR